MFTIPHFFVVPSSFGNLPGCKYSGDENLHIPASILTSSLYYINFQAVEVYLLKPPVKIYILLHRTNSLKMLLILQFMLCLPILIQARPGNVAASVAVAAAGAKPPVYIDKGGNVGVDFLGYKASAGLGGLLTGDATAGGLHAEAGTPHGQAAAAGLGGSIDSVGTSGGLYAGATAGADVAASATLSGASSGTVTKTKTRTKTIVTEEVQPKTTLIERTVVPNYVEKTVQVPTYVEKVVRVPTYVEQTVKVPVEPTVIEKVVETPVKVRRPHYHFHQHLKSRIGGGYAGETYGSSNVQATITKTANPQLFNDIFAIPISTLGAVNNLLNGISAGTSGSASLSVSKAVAVGK